MKASLLNRLLLALLVSLSLGKSELSAQTTNSPQPILPSPVGKEPLELKPGSAVPIRYLLTKPGKVSLNIYDEKGHVIRELLHVTQREAGEHLEIWDGLDREGHPLPAGKYSWKVLATPGLKAEFLMKVGTSFPIKPNADWWQQAPGDITGPGSVFADESGLYVGSATENIGPCLIKQTLDGSKRLWEQKLPSAYVVPRGSARMGDTLWIFSINDKYLLPLNADTGAGAGQPISTLWDKESGSFMAPVGDFLVVGYPKKNAVRWFDPATGKVAATLEVSNPTALAGFQNLLYIADGKAIWRVAVGDSLEKLEAVPFVQGLTGASLLAIDPTTGDVLAYEGNETGGGNNQIKRFSPDGKLLQTYGRPGGRKHGLYTQEEQESFSGVFSLACLPDGRFAVSEAWMPPRRAAVFTKDGKLQQEWYGSQMWAPFIFPEPDNPNAIWMASDWNGFMRLLVDYDTKTWKVHSTYRWDSMPLSGSSSDIGTGLNGFVHDGELYLQREGQLDLSRVDRKNWKLVQVIGQVTDLQTRYGQKQHELSPQIQKWMAPHSLKNLWLDSFWWTDNNGDGVVQTEEVQWRRKTSTKVWTDANGDGQLQPEEESSEGLPLLNAGLFLDGQFNVYWMDPQFRFGKLPVTGWNSFGAPLYGKPIPPPAVTAPDWLVEKAKGPNFPTVDSSTGDVYVAANNFKAWAQSSASYMVRIGADGAFKWAVGGAGSDPGQILYFRRNLGVVKGCVAATNTSNEWPNELLPRTYVWDRDGLYLGGLLDSPQLKPGEPLWHFAAGAEAKNGVVWENPQTGEVLYFGHWTSEGRIYKITGWDGWERFSGTVELSSPAGTGGNGILATSTDANGTAIGQSWLAPKLEFDAAKISKLTKPASKVTVGGVRFLGQIVAPTDGSYEFTTKGFGRTRLLINGRIVLDNGLPPDMQSLVLKRIPLKAGQRYWIQFDYSPEPGKLGRIECLWSLEGNGAQPIPSLALLATPNPDAMPFGQGVGLTGVYYPRVISLPDLIDPKKDVGAHEIMRIDPEINTEARSHSIIWQGYFQPRNTGWTRLRAGDGYVIRMKLQEALTTEPYVFMEAGKKYPLTVYARAWSDVSNNSFKFRLETSRWTAPNTTNENMVLVPQSQLYPLTE